MGRILAKLQKDSIQGVCVSIARKSTSALPSTAKLLALGRSMTVGSYKACSYQQIFSNFTILAINKLDELVRLPAD